MTAVVMALCGIILNLFAFTCLIPALFFAMKVSLQQYHLQARLLGVGRELRVDVRIVIPELWYIASSPGLPRPESQLWT